MPGHQVGLPQKPKASSTVAAGGFLSASWPPPGRRLASGGRARFSVVYALSDCRDRGSKPERRHRPERLLGDSGGPTDLRGARTICCLLSNSKTSARISPEGILATRKTSIDWPLERPVPPSFRSLSLALHVSWPWAYQMRRPCRGFRLRSSHRGGRYCSAPFQVTQSVVNGWQQSRKRVYRPVTNADKTRIAVGGQSGRCVARVRDGFSLDLAARRQGRPA